MLIRGKLLMLYVKELGQAFQAERSREQRRRKRSDVYKKATVN